MNHFRSLRTEEQKVLSRNTLPTSVEDTYKHCDVPPSLNMFTPYRDDQKEGLTFYTDPDYFYRLWVEDQNQQLEKKKKRVSDIFEQMNETVKSVMHMVMHHHIHIRRVYDGASVVDFMLDHMFNTGESCEYCTLSHTCIEQSHERTSCVC